jgi:uncharacterized protein YkwD
MGRRSRGPIRADLPARLTGDSGRFAADPKRWPRLAPLLLVFTLLANTAPGPAPGVTLDSEEAAFLDLLNAYRSANGTGPLTVDAELRSAARWMAEDMATNDYFSHTDSLGRDTFTRMDAFGYSYNTWRGENLAAAVETAQAAMDIWKGSSGHNSNMLNPHYRAVGIARAYGPGSSFGWYWATKFGGHTGTAPRPLPPVQEPVAPPPALTPAPTAPEPAPATPAPTPDPEPTMSPSVTHPPTPQPEPSSRWWQVSRLVRYWLQGITREERPSAPSGRVFGATEVAAIRTAARRPP